MAGLLVGVDATAHPAQFSPKIIEAFQKYIDEFVIPFTPHPKVLDPFAGVGNIHRLVGCDTYGIELEPAWATQHPRTLVGDATALPFGDNSFDVAITSPCYANRMSDHHNAKDGSYRRTYTHHMRALLNDDTVKLHERNAGQMQWGEGYRKLHEEAWAEVYRVLKPNSYFLLNVKDHQRKHAKVSVSAWHANVCRDLGFRLMHIQRIETRHFRYGANRRRFPERVLVFLKLRWYL